MTGRYARGACPRLAEPMQTGDGLLARIVTAGPIALDAFSRLCAAARQHGNGVIEISARGSLQVRGLTPVSAPLFASSVATLDIDLGDGVPVIADPLADDPAALINANALAADLRRAIAAKALTLAPKVSVVVDGGGRLHLDALNADIRLRAVATPDGPMLHVGLAGDAASATPLGLVARGNAVTVAIQLLASIAALGLGARARDLLRNTGIGALRAALNIEPALPLPARPRAEAIALHRLADGMSALGTSALGMSALGLGLAFGHAQADTLTDLAALAEAHGARWVRPAPDRALLLGPFSDAAAVAARHAAERLGFVVRLSDPRRRIVACPGAPSCASGLIAARAIAAELARHLPASLSLVHVSGCGKGCAHPAPAPLTVVGASQGCGIVRNGTSRMTPETYADPAGIVAEIERLGETREAAHA